jgi:5-(carboxyamino)imidazole ribonucleotide synthase
LSRKAEERDVISPGATIGILGGGQLGRMTAMAARTMGYRVLVLDPDPACPARPVADECITAKWDDAEAAAELARNSDVVTLEIEQISIDSLRAAEEFAPVRPRPEMLRIIQDRILQREWLAANGFPQGEWRAVRSLADLEAAVPALGGRVYMKSARGGYDGRSQAKIGFGDKSADSDEIAAAWKSLGERDAAVERAQDLAMELSVMVARSPSGEVKAFPPATNHHERQILAWSVLPMMLPHEIAAKVDAAKLEREARTLAVGIAEKFQLEGLLAVEMFLTSDGKLLVNELAPRPHNSYHESEQACVTSQFEQAVRAVCGLPLGETDIVTPAAIVNLLGDVWLQGREPYWAAALGVPGVRLHLYEKQVAKPGRKMGHLSAVGKTPGEAVERVLEAKAKL